MENPYYCSNCNKDVDAETCPTCTLPTRPKASKAASGPNAVSSGAPEGVSPSPVRPAAADPSLTPRPALPPRPVSVPPSLAPRPVSLPRAVPAPPRPSSVPPPTPTLSAPAGASEESAPAHLQDFLDRKYEIYLIAGINQTGKSQLLASYRQSGFLDQWVRRQGGVIPTIRGEDLKCYPIHLGRRKIVFMDAAGERFWQLYPTLLSLALRTTRTVEIGESQIGFLRHISKHLKGLILLLDLQRLWGPEQANHPSNSRQIEILEWVLTLLRWLRFDGKYLSGPISLEEHVNRTVMRMSKRLDIPVQVLFSKADCLNGLLIPQSQTLQWLRPSVSVERALHPPGEDPLLLAYHCLPKLLEALRVHARHFRFDFVHSLVGDPDTQEVIDPDACGVTLSLQWLLDANWRKPWPMLPAGFWLGLQRFLDTVVKRNDRWRRLPDSSEVRV